MTEDKIQTKNYVGVFRNCPPGGEIFVYVGDRFYFPSDGCEMLHKIELNGMNLNELYDDAMKENVLFGGLCCYPSCDLPPEKWEAVNMSAGGSIDDIVDSAYNYFKKFYPKKKE